uniref:DUF5658 domain-containing protein n=1 Tax=viral metagenome TaxID=1070528 RepID=A0A6M3ME09_9ZZZZ
MRGKFEGGAYLVVVAGIVGDQLSTRLGLARPGIYETNPYAVMLMSKGLWLPVDILLLTLSIGIPAVLMRKWGFEGRWAVLSFPLVLGTLRLAAAVWNLHLFLF